MPKSKPKRRPPTITFRYGGPETLTALAKLEKALGPSVPGARSIVIRQAILAAALRLGGAK